MKKMSWSEGWHTAGNISYLVEYGRIIRGVKNGVTVYPFRPSRLGSGLECCTGIKACLSSWKKISWY